MALLNFSISNLNQYRRLPKRKWNSPRLCQSYISSAFSAALSAISSAPSWRAVFRSFSNWSCRAVLSSMNIQRWCRSFQSVLRLPRWGICAASQA
ncbi:hypothetical protein D3C76_1136980 [compost metagenome]